MAIPCYMSQVDDPEENYRRLERLLYELYHVLRALLGPMPAAGQAASSPGNTGGSNGPHPPQGGAGGSGGSSGGSPPATAAEVARSRARRGRRHHSATGATPTDMPAPQSPHSSRPVVPTALRGVSRISFDHGNNTTSTVNSWTKLGGELRLIADTFSASRQQHQSGPVQCSAGSTKISSLQLVTSTLRLLRHSWTEAD